jgi:hypothetical protein
VFGGNIMAVRKLIGELKTSEVYEWFTEINGLGGGKEATTLTSRLSVVASHLGPVSCINRFVCAPYLLYFFEVWERRLFSSGSPGGESKDYREKGFVPPPLSRQQRPTSSTAEGTTTVETTDLRPI